MLRAHELLRRFIGLTTPGSLSGWVSPPATGLDPAASEDAAFADHSERQLLLTSRISAGLCLLVALLWWPVDLLIYRRDSGLHHPPVSFRIVICVLCAAYLLLPRRGLQRRLNYPLLVATLSTLMAFIGYIAGELGGLDRPWFHLGYPLLSATINFPLALRRRTVLVMLQGLGFLGGFLIFHPVNLASPYLPMTLSLVLLITVANIALGHHSFLLFKDNFRKALALSRNAAELEDRVAEKTQALRDLLAHVEGVVERERMRISRELHDELGQELTALRYALGLARERFQRDPAAAEKNLGELEHLLRRTTRTVRELVSQLRPLVLDDLGLKAAVEWLVARTTESSGLPCTLEFAGDDHDLQGEVLSAAYRVLQESLTNAVRHAQATQLSVRVRRTAEHLELAVRDNGCGFDAAARPSGMGLLGMRERALSLGAQLVLRSSAGQGTEVSCRLPLCRSRSQEQAALPSQAQGL